MLQPNNNHLRILQPTNDHLRTRQQAPQSEPSMHQTPLCILMTPNKNSGELFTLPGGHLLHGIRNSTGIIRNATHIIDQHNIDFVPKAAGFIHDDESRPYGLAYLVEPAHRTHVPVPINRTGPSRGELIPALPQPETSPTLELHHYTALIARIQSINYRRKQLNERRTDDSDKLPLCEAEEAFLRSFGRYIMQRVIH
ncbi:MAG: hypothetical protein JWM07_490 [Candidatus Saccharibacteria bacterium]|nr:hypothetical protein [Candidatus Saccharibacteria bacterium]